MHAETKQKRNNNAETCTIIFFGQAGLIETLKIFRTVSEVYLQKKNHLQVKKHMDGSL